VIAGEPDRLERVTSPESLLARDRNVTLQLWLVGSAILLAFGLAIVVAVGLVAGLAAGHKDGGIAGALRFLLVVWLMIGLPLGLVLAFRWSGNFAAWPSYMLTRGWLAWRGELPWPLMSFLADAHRRGVLRQVGAVYQFRHIELQHRLANRDSSAVSRQEE
jgi:hypothetical protein